MAAPGVFSLRNAAPTPAQIDAAIAERNAGPRISLGSTTRTVFADGQYVGVAQRRADGDAWTYHFSGTCDKPGLLDINEHVYANLDKLTEAVREAVR